MPSPLTLAGVRFPSLLVSELRARVAAHAAVVAGHPRHAVEPVAPVDPKAVKVASTPKPTMTSFFGKASAIASSAAAAPPATARAALVASAAAGKWPVSAGGSPFALTGAGARGGPASSSLASSFKSKKPRNGAQAGGGIGAHFKLVKSPSATAAATAAAAAEVAAAATAAAAAEDEADAMIDLSVSDSEL